MKRISKLQREQQVDIHQEEEELNSENEAEDQVVAVILEKEIKMVDHPDIMEATKEDGD